MKPKTRITIGLGLAGCAALLFMLLQMGSSDTLPAGPKWKSGGMTPQATKPRPAQPVEEAPVLPPPVIAAEPVIQWSPVPAVVAWQHGTAFRFVRPTGESMMSTWAARDPEGAGQWLNQNRAIPNFADYVRGYAIQIATIDPDAARQWAAQLNGSGNRFALGGTLEQHIDAIAEMLKPAAAVGGGSAPSDQQSKASSMFLLDYTPRLVRQHPGEDPVIEMEPVNPFA